MRITLCCILTTLCPCRYRWLVKAARHVYTRDVTIRWALFPVGPLYFVWYPSISSWVSLLALKANVLSPYRETYSNAFRELKLSDFDAILLNFGPRFSIDDKSWLVSVMAGCKQATGLYQWSPMTHIFITRPHWVNQISSRRTARAIVSRYSR